jgi:hypothetical protein
MSHHHRDTTSPPEPIHTVNLSEEAKQFGDAIESLDPEILNFVLASIRGYNQDDAIHYVGKAIQLARKSEEYAMAERVTLESKAEVSSKLVAMFALGFIAGGSCTLMAVDEGFIAEMEPEGEGPDPL